MKAIDFANTEEEIRGRMLETFFWLRAQIKAFLDRFGLTHQQYNVLKIVQSCNRELPYSTKEISKQMIDRHADTSRVVDRLINKGLLNKKPCTMDGRLVRVSLAPKGHTLLQMIADQQHELDSITQRLDHNEKDMLLYIFNKLIDNQ